MTLNEAMLRRHSVRQYTDKEIESEKVEILRREIDNINNETGMSFQLVLNDPEAFSSKIMHYGSFSGVRNYYILAASPDRDEDIGYYGEKLVLLSQQLGLNTCWVALTYNRSKVRSMIAKNDKIYVVISVGYGLDQGVAHKNKDISRFYKTGTDTPDWFINAVKAAMTAPTAVNQQKFFFELLDGDRVSARAGVGPCSKIDLGIVKYHFEIGAGEHSFTFI